jgi:hypothetical protein
MQWRWTVLNGLAKARHSLEMLSFAKAWYSTEMMGKAKAKKSNCNAKKFIYACFAC